MFFVGHRMKGGFPSGTGRSMGRIHLVFLAVVLGGFLAAGVNGADPVAAAPADEVPVVAGCEVDYPPFCVVRPDGQADGFSVELLRAALKALGRETTFRTGFWPEIKRDLSDGRLQVLPMVGRTPEREAIYDFTFPYLTTMALR